MKHADRFIDGLQIVMPIILAILLLVVFIGLIIKYPIFLVSVPILLLTYLIGWRFPDKEDDDELDWPEERS